MTTRSGDEAAQHTGGDLPFGGRYTAAVEAAVQKLAVRARDKGLEPDQVNALIDTLPYASMLDATAKEIHAELVGGISSLIVSLDDGEREIADSLAEVWGPADRLYRAFVYAAYELGAVISRASIQPTPTVEALLGLHPRAVRVAAEVRHLAMGGFAAGATGRGRSLHDLAVVSFVLADAPEEIAERYLAYSHIERCQDLRAYQANAKKLNRSLLDAGTVQKVEAAATEVADRWGKTIRTTNGWAVPLFPGAGRNGVTFRQLEELAGLGHLRPIYRLGNHHVHAGPRASELNRRSPEVPGAPALITAGPTVWSDIGETCHGAMISLQQATVALCNAYIATDPRAEVDITVSLKAAVTFVEDAGPAYGEAADRARTRGWFRRGVDG